MNNSRFRQLQTNKNFVVALVFGLLLAQWLVLTHVHDQQSTSPDSLCSVCVTGEHFSHAVSSSPVVVTSQAVTQTVLDVFEHIILQQFVPFFHSRAPPVLL